MKKKKYNPLKKYSHGGKHGKGGKPGKGARPEVLADQAAEDEEIKGEEKEEDLMKGRSFIPRMSTSQKQAIIEGGKNALEKRKDKKLFMEEGGTKEEYKDIRKERKEIQRKKDLGLDTSPKRMESFNVSVGGNVDYNKPHEKTSFASSSKDRSIASKKLSQKLSAAGVTGSDLSSAQRKAKLTQGSGGKYTRSTEVSSPMDIKKYGGKLKKYAKGGKVDPVKKSRA